MGERNQEILRERREKRNSRRKGERGASREEARNVIVFNLGRTLITGKTSNDEKRS